MGVFKIRSIHIKWVCALTISERIPKNVGRVVTGGTEPEIGFWWEDLHIFIICPLAVFELFLPH